MQLIFHSRRCIYKQCHINHATRNLLR